MKNPLDAVKIFLGVVCVAGAFAAAAFAPGPGGGQPAAPSPSPSPAPTASPAPSPSPSPAPEVTLAFTGDVNFADDWYNMLHYANTAGVEDCFDPLLLEEMQSADVLLSNNEFAFSDRGAPMAGKQFTFCSRPENVEIWRQLGVDVVSLANNHCFDYGADAFADTMTTLSDAGIVYVGAGADLEEAMTPRYFTVDGLTIGYVACTRAEKYVLTPEAGESSPGVLRCYDPELAVQVIEEASSQCDYLVVYVHWGTEYSTQLEQAQTDLATLFAEAGADLIVGSHPHILQGAGWRGDVPVIYSLGNFWFNMETVDTALLTVTLTGPGAENATVRMIPCVQTGGRTSILTDEGEKTRILDHLNSISESGWFDADGVLHPPEEQP